MTKPPTVHRAAPEPADAPEVQEDTAQPSIADLQAQIAALAAENAALKAATEPGVYKSAADQTATGTVVLEAYEDPDIPSIDLTGAEDMMVDLLAIDASAKAQGHSLHAILSKMAAQTFGITV